MIAPLLARRSAAGFWLAVLLTGIGTGLAAAALAGLFTPSLAKRAMLGGLLGQPWSWLWPGVPPGSFALLAAAAAVLATTTRGPISTIVLIMELTGHARAAMVPLFVFASATLVARALEPRLIYDARLNDARCGRGSVRAITRGPNEHG